MPSKTRKKYCSEKCKKLKEAERSQTNREKTKEEVKKHCEVCGKEFVVTHGRQNYCSPKCKQIKRSKYSNEYYHKSKEIVPERICKCCGKQFAPNDRYRVYCSNACKLKANYQYKQNYYDKKIKPKRGRKPNSKETLCWSCKNACGGCSWSRNLVPVEGWNTIPVKIKGIKTQSYKVISCPKFERGR